MLRRFDSVRTRNSSVTDEKKCPAACQGRFYDFSITCAETQGSYGSRHGRKLPRLRRSFLFPSSPPAANPAPPNSCNTATQSAPGHPQTHVPDAHRTWRTALRSAPCHTVNPDARQLRRLGRLDETRPARPRIKLRLRIEQRRPAAHAVIHPRLFRVPVFPGKRALRARLPRHVILLVGVSCCFHSASVLTNFSAVFFSHESHSISMIIFFESIRCSHGRKSDISIGATSPLPPPPSDTSPGKKSAAHPPAPPHPRLRQ